MNKRYSHFLKIFMVMLVPVIFSACQEAVSHSGIIQNSGNGVKAVYNGLEPENIILLMNGEEINHTDIPLGESFILVNNKTRGLTQKEGKVSIGCALLIKDTSGNTLMDEPDLFKGNDLLDASETTVLRCTINTGKPMKWDETYQVTVKFWDKYGTGNIVNTFNIQIIDIP